MASQQPKVDICDSFPDLGRVTAAHFVRQIQTKPDSVVSLPTGKTPEYFIKWTMRILEHWDTQEINTLRKEFELSDTRPSMHLVRFVQIDEFFPTHPSQENSFNHFVREHYIKGFGLDESKCVLMDTSSFAGWADFPNGVDLEILMKDEQELDGNQICQRQILARVDQYCKEYETKIRDMGGLDFFLGGIGPDGHVAFNIRGSSFESITRMLKLNYESMSSSAESLGGMSIARRSAVITIGLGTITFNPSCKCIIFASGAGKADVVKRALGNDIVAEEPSHALRKLPDLSIFLTKGSSKFLFGKQRVAPSEKEIFTKIERGSNAISNAKKISHTEPHHDDIMLGYLPFILRARSHSRGDEDSFVCATSGYNSVSNGFIKNVLTEIAQSDNARASGTPLFDLEVFKRGFVSNDENSMRRGLVSRISRLISSEDAADGVNYMDSLYPGQKPNDRILNLKAACREFEAESLWFVLGWKPDSFRHLRLSFYNADLFQSNPDYLRDCMPIYKLLEEQRPDIVTVALDPESSGPDTHYKVLQAVTTAVLEYSTRVDPDIKIWGYRNVWSQFDVQETDMIIPVTADEMQKTHQLFMACYQTQKTAEFPSHKLDGPFSKIVVDTWKNQLDQIRELLGNSPFEDDVQGVLFMKEMSVEQLTAYSIALNRSVNGSST